MTPEEIKAKFSEHENRITGLEKDRSAMQTTINHIRSDTAEIVEILRDAKGAWRVFEWVGKAAKPLAWIAAMIAAASIWWSKLKGGQ